MVVVNKNELLMACFFSPGEKNIIQYSKEGCYLDTLGLLDIIYLI